jgi:hypothetical protein
MTNNITSWLRREPKELVMPMFDRCICCQIIVLYPYPITEGVMTIYNFIKLEMPYYALNNGGLLAGLVKSYANPVI